jgi:hypothetical protein
MKAASRPMSQDYVRSIAERSQLTVVRRVFWITLAVTLIAGAFAALHYASAHLTLSHYDARAHLVVSRRVTDSLTPGWRQFGSVWLPLPHIANLLPSAWDWGYRTGAVAVAISILSIGAGLAALARTLVLRTGSVAAGIAAPALVLANPNVLYLMATPMTEPLLFGLTLLSLAAVDDWIARPSPRSSRRAGGLLAALVLTRYEGWLVAAALITVAMGLSWQKRPAGLHRLWGFPLLAIAVFLALSLAATGQWPMSESFFVPDPELLHQPLVVLTRMMTGLLELAGLPLAIAGAAGVVMVLASARSSPHVLVFVAPLAAAALPFVAFYDGHPYRVRYLVPVVFAAAVLASIALPALTRLPRFTEPMRLVAAAVLVLASAWARPPLDPKAAMVVEAQWETPFRLERQKVTAALVGRDDGSPVLASMGSLAHYMHETSQAGFALRRFLHEGNGDLWTEALKGPRRSVRWILIEERAEGGDVLAARARSDPGFLDGFERVAEGGGLVLYERK